MRVNLTTIFLFSLQFFLINMALASAAAPEALPERNSQLPEKFIIVIIPSFNNLNFYKKNIDSVLMQKYENYRVLYIDDCSTDGMSEAVQEYIADHDAADRWIYVRNWRNCGALSNWYYGIHECPDEAIIVNLDGDDWLKHENVLARINEEYADENVWLTYGQFEWRSSGARGFCCPPKPEIVNGLSKMRKHSEATSHLRTFYAWLFKKIKITDLQYEGKFFPAAVDIAMMSPMLEMAGLKHFKFIDEILYVYNDGSPLNLWRERQQLQKKMAAHVWSMPSYQPLDSIK